MVLLLALLGCGKPVDDGEVRDSSDGPDTGDTDTGHGDDTGVDPFACPEVAPPSLSTETWVASGDIPAGGFNTLATDGGAPIWAGSHTNGIWRADDDLAWEVIRVQISHTLSEIALRPGDPDHAFRSAGGNLQRTRDGGTNWDRLAPGDGASEGIPSDPVWAVAVTPWNPDRVLILGASGEASVSTDDGDTFETLGFAPIREPPYSDDPAMTWGWRILPEVEEGGRVVFSDGFGVATSDDGMLGWTRRLDLPGGAGPLLRDPLDPDHLLLGGEDGVYESHDEGSTWSLHELGGGVLVGAWATDGSWLALVGASTVYVSTDAGASFTSTNHGLHMPGAAAILDDGRLLLAHHTGMGASSDRGASFVDVSSGLVDTGMSTLTADPTCAPRLWAGSRCGGGIFTSADYGATWTPVPHYFHYVMGLTVDPVVAGRLWGVSDDKLLRSDDNGATWEEVWRRYHFHGFVTHPVDPDVLLLGSVGSGGWSDERMRVYRSDDGGASWDDSSTGLPESEASAHVLVRWPDAPDVVLLGTYKAGDVSHLFGFGDGLFRSTDGGATWAAAALPVSDVAFLAETAPGDPQPAVFAATDLGIWRSTDQGVTWEVRPGPTGSLLSVAIRGAIGVALGADGVLWKSTDAGDTWFEHGDSLPRNLSTTLAQVGISLDATVAYVTVYDHGVWRIGL